MAKSILTELDKAMKERNIKIPALALRLDIPASRMYKWYQQGTNPKTEDAVKIWDWINGIIADSQTGEEQVEYKTVPTLLKMLVDQQTLLADQHKTIHSQQETLHFLTTGGGAKDNEKKASG